MAHPDIIIYMEQFNFIFLYLHCGDDLGFKNAATYLWRTV